MASAFTNFGIQIHQGYYLDMEQFVLEFTAEQAEYLDYITSQIRARYGSITSFSALQVGDVLTGRLFNPGKVGFGIFVDIGIRKPQQTDALLPLFQLRKHFRHEQASTREIVKIHGLADQLRVPVEITKLEPSPKKSKIEVKLSVDYIEQIEDWSESKLDVIIITKTLTRTVQQALSKRELSKFVANIESVDPLTTYVHLRKGTRAHGIIPQIGPLLPRSPLGIFVGSSR